MKTPVSMDSRVKAYAQAIPQYQASWPHIVSEQDRQVAIGTWVLGNNYRAKNQYYGEYPPGYLTRIMAMFPDKTDILHVFSGSLPPGPYTRCDSHQDSELRCSVYDLPTQTAGTFDLILADPPYTAVDAAKYGTAMVNRRRAIAALVEVARPGAHLVWLDTVWPMHRKTQWVTVGRITIIRSTNHRVRMVTIFERTGG